MAAFSYSEDRTTKSFPSTFVRIYSYVSAPLWESIGNHETPKCVLSSHPSVCIYSTVALWGIVQHKDFKSDQHILLFKATDCTAASAATFVTAAGPKHDRQIQKL